MGEMIDVRVGDRRVKVYRSKSEKNDAPGVLLVHAWWGLNRFFRMVADRLAKEGFTVMAPDLYNGKTATTVEQAKEFLDALDHDEGIKIVTACVDHLVSGGSSADPKVGVIGFSMGASYATWLSTLRPSVKAVVLFYGGLYSPVEAFPTKTDAAFQGHFAETDEFESLDDVHKLEEELHDAGRKASFHVYPGTQHWFFESDRPDAFNAEAAALAMSRTLAFLKEELR
jgi:carboxymethylenebutenolidase